MSLLSIDQRIAILNQQIDKYAAEAREAGATRRRLLITDGKNALPTKLATEREKRCRDKRGGLTKMRQALSERVVSFAVEDWFKEWADRTGVQPPPELETEKEEEAQNLQKKGDSREATLKPNKPTLNERRFRPGVPLCKSIELWRREVEEGLDDEHDLDPDVASYRDDPGSSREPFVSTSSDLIVKHHVDERLRSPRLGTELGLESDEDEAILCKARSPVREKAAVNTEDASKLERQYAFPKVRRQRRSKIFVGADFDSEEAWTRPPKVIPADVGHKKGIARRP